MSDEHDSWFKGAFGLDLGGVIDQVRDEVSATVDKVKNAVSQGRAGASMGETGSFPLGGSVGRGGKNATSDVRAVQAALGIPADGQCGPQTVAAIEAYQKSMGQAKPDGRVDAGGATERALADGAKPFATPATPGAGLGDSPGGYNTTDAWPQKGFGSEVAQEGDLVGALLEQQAALLQSLQNAGSRAEREHIEEELEGVNAEISSELWTLQAAEAIQEAQSPQALARAEEFRQLNPQLEQRYATASGNFTQRQLDAQRISRGIDAARMGVAAAGTLWATDDVGLAELVGAVSGALGSLAKPLAPVTGRSTLPSASPRSEPDPIGVDVRGLPKGTMLASATKSGRGGTSPIGRHIQKHAMRPAKAFTSPGGDGKANTELGRKFLTDLLSDPQTTVTSRVHKKYGELIDVRRRDGAGAAFTTKGEYVNLLEPYNRIPGWTSSL